MNKNIVTLYVLSIITFDLRNWWPGWWKMRMSNSVCILYTAACCDAYFLIEHLHHTKFYSSSLFLLLYILLHSCLHYTLLYLFVSKDGIHRSLWAFWFRRQRYQGIHRCHWISPWVRLHVYLYIYSCIYVCVYLPIYLCMYLCIYVSISSFFSIYIWFLQHFNIFIIS